MAPLTLNYRDEQCSMCAGQLRVSGDLARSLGPPSVEDMGVNVSAEVNAVGWFDEIKRGNEHIIE